MVLLGLLLLIGALAPRRERRAVLEQGEHGTLDARGALAQMFTALAERTRGVTHAKAKLRLGGECATGGWCCEPSARARRRAVPSARRSSPTSVSWRPPSASRPGPSPAGAPRPAGAVMLRQRLRTRTSPLAFIQRLLDSPSHWRSSGMASSSPASPST